MCGPRLRAAGTLSRRSCWLRINNIDFIPVFLLMKSLRDAVRGLVHAALIIVSFLVRPRRRYCFYLINLITRFGVSLPHRWRTITRTSRSAVAPKPIPQNGRRPTCAKMKAARNTKSVLFEESVGFSSALPSFLRISSTGSIRRPSQTYRVRSWRPSTMSPSASRLGRPSPYSTASGSSSAA